jgi:mono/diheme cytochrome c family protein
MIRHTLIVLAVIALGGWTVEFSPAGQKGDVQAGAALHKKHCLRCHGEKGRGDGPASRLLTPKPHDWSDKEYMATFSDDDLHKIIVKGGPAVGKSKLMTAFEGKLKEADVRHLIAFIRAQAAR